jgi:hypothetical protein
MQLITDINKHRKPYLRKSVMSSLITRNGEHYEASTDHKMQWLAIIQRYLGDHRYIPLSF